MDVRTELQAAFDAVDAMGLRKATSQIRVDDKMCDVPAWDVGVDGLVVTKALDTGLSAPSQLTWAITHVNSGLKVSPDFATRTVAVRWARALAALANWNRLPEEVHADVRCQDLAKALVALNG